MSWSFQGIGYPDKVIEALEADKAHHNGQYLEEYLAALPHLVALVKQNFSEPENPQPVVEIEASGTGWAREGQQVFRNCEVSIKTIWKKLLV